MNDLERVAKYLCRDDFDADDLVSETVLKAFEKIESLQETARAKPWLLRIMHNAFIDQIRKRKKPVSINHAEDEPEEAFSLYREVMGRLESTNDPETSFTDSILGEDIERAIAELPLEFREAVILNLVEDLTYQEIASTLQIPIGTVRSRIARGRKLLQKSLFVHALDRGILPKEKRTASGKCDCGEDDSGELSTPNIRHHTSIKQ